MPESWASIGTICGTLLRFGWKWRGSVSGLFRMPWGHKSIAMNVRYSHLAPGFLLNVVEKLVP